MNRRLAKRGDKLLSSVASPTRYAMMEKLGSRPVNGTAVAEGEGMKKDDSTRLECGLVYSKGKGEIYRLDSETLETISVVVEDYAERFLLTEMECASSK